MQIKISKVLSLIEELGVLREWVEDSTIGPVPGYFDRKTHSKELFRNYATLKSTVEARIEEIENMEIEATFIPTAKGVIYEKNK